MNIKSIIFQILRNIPLVNQLGFVRSYSHFKRAISLIEKIVNDLEQTVKVALDEEAKAQDALKKVEQDRANAAAAFQAREDALNASIADSIVARENADRVAARLTNLAA